MPSTRRGSTAAVAENRHPNTRPSRIPKPGALGSTTLPSRLGPKGGLALTSKGKGKGKGKGRGSVTGSKAIAAAASKRSFVVAEDDDASSSESESGSESESESESGSGSVSSDSDSDSESDSGSDSDSSSDSDSGSESDSESSSASSRRSDLAVQDAADPAPVAEDTDVPRDHEEIEELEEESVVAMDMSLGGCEALDALDATASSAVPMDCSDFDAPAAVHDDGVEPENHDLDDTVPDINPDLADGDDSVARAPGPVPSRSTPILARTVTVGGIDRGVPAGDDDGVIFFGPRAVIASPRERRAKLSGHGPASPSAALSSPLRETASMAHAASIAGAAIELALADPSSPTVAIRGLGAAVDADTSVCSSASGSTSPSTAVLQGAGPGLAPSAMDSPAALQGAAPSPRMSPASPHCEDGDDVEEAVEKRDGEKDVFATAAAAAAAATAAAARGTAAVHLQRFARGMLARRAASAARAERDLRAVRDAAATAIAKTVRGAAARHRYLRVQAAVVCAQRVARGFLARAIAATRRAEVAVAKAAEAAAQIAAEEALSRTRELAATHIQRMIRGRQARVSAARLRRAHAELLERQERLLEQRRSRTDTAAAASAVRVPEASRAGAAAGDSRMQSVMAKCEQLKKNAPASSSTSSTAAGSKAMSLGGSAGAAAPAAKAAAKPAVSAAIAAARSRLSAAAGAAADAPAPVGLAQAASAVGAAGPMDPARAELEEKKRKLAQIRAERLLLQSKLDSARSTAAAAAAATAKAPAAPAKTPAAPAAAAPPAPAVSAASQARKPVPKPQPSGIPSAAAPAAAAAKSQLPAMSPRAGIPAASLSDLVAEDLDDSGFDSNASFDVIMQDDPISADNAGPSPAMSRRDSVTGERAVFTINRDALTTDAEEEKPSPEDAAAERAREVQTRQNTAANAKTHVQCVLPEHRLVAAQQLQRRGLQLPPEAGTKLVAVIDNNKVSTDYEDLARPTSNRRGIVWGDASPGGSLCEYDDSPANAPSTPRHATAPRTPTSIKSKRREPFAYANEAPSPLYIAGKTHGRISALLRSTVAKNHQAQRAQSAAGALPLSRR